MATGIEMYRAVKNATRDLRTGSDFAIHPVDLTDLFKLTPVDLVTLGYGQDIAEEVSGALFRGEFDLLGVTMGVRFIRTFEAERLDI